MEMMNKWFTRYLHGVENGVENEPKSYIVREGKGRNEPTEYADYPNPDAEDVTLSLGSGGNEKGALSLYRLDGQGNETLVDDVSFSAGQLAKADESKNRLLYVTPTLKEDLHLSGVFANQTQTCQQQACLQSFRLGRFASLGRTCRKKPQRQYHYSWLGRSSKPAIQSPRASRLSRANLSRSHSNCNRMIRLFQPVNRLV